MTAESAFDELLVPLVDEVLPDLVQAYGNPLHADSQRLVERVRQTVRDTYLADVDDEGFEDPERYRQDSELAAAVAEQVLSAVALRQVWGDRAALG